MRVVSHLHVSNANQSSSNLHALCLESTPLSAGADMTMQFARHQIQFYQLSVNFCISYHMKESRDGQQAHLVCTPFLLPDVQASTLQVQQAKDTLSDERHSHQDSQQALESSQQLLAAAYADQQQLRAQVADLQLQLQGSTAAQSDLQVAIHAADAKLSASEADLAGTHSQVSYSHFCVLEHIIHSPLQPDPDRVTGVTGHQHCIAVLALHHICSGQRLVWHSLCSIAVAADFCMLPSEIVACYHVRYVHTASACAHSRVFVFMQTHDGVLLHTLRIGICPTCTGQEGSVSVAYHVVFWSA